MISPPGEVRERQRNIFTAGRTSRADVEPSGGSLSTSSSLDNSLSLGDLLTEFRRVLCDETGKISLANFFPTRMFVPIEVLQVQQHLAFRIGLAWRDATSKKLEEDLTGPPDCQADYPTVNP
ncbi:hypothetical protein BIW11_02482 [Tropilaelaps mercedesae]|uniref:Uncharacterized protein n=1 Tax=Tropilaelaps mercedesae TaxID=418985 RepID=A0A1V9Y2D8_9ACAR|nr:hypothetical protein BIW11_02482 [Tropilaelaps mercedesae]